MDNNFKFIREQLFKNHDALDLDDFVFLAKIAANYEGKASLLEYENFNLIIQKFVVLLTAANKITQKHYDFLNVLLSMPKSNDEFVIKNYDLFIKLINEKNSMAPGFASFFIDLVNLYSRSHFEYSIVTEENRPVIDGVIKKINEKTFVNLETLLSFMTWVIKNNIFPNTELPCPKSWLDPYLKNPGDRLAVKSFIDKNLHVEKEDLENKWFLMSIACGLNDDMNHSELTIDEKAKESFTLLNKQSKQKLAGKIVPVSAKGSINDGDVKQPRKRFR